MGQVRRLFLSRSTTGKHIHDHVDQPALTAPRKHSLSSTQGSLGVLREAGLPSARTRGSLTPGFDGILNSGETWTSRRRASESGTKLNSNTPLRGDGELQPASRLKIDEEEEKNRCRSGTTPDPTEQDASSQSLGHSPSDSPPGAEPSIDNDVTTTSASVNGSEGPPIHNATQSVSADAPVRSSASPATVPTALQPVTNPVGVEWSYLDPQGQVQGTQASPLPGAYSISSLQAHSRPNLCRSGMRKAILL
jgi:PERQ amino acid-rich with GYF domain-containing protein